MQDAQDVGGSQEWNRRAVAGCPASFIRGMASCGRNVGQGVEPTMRNILDPELLRKIGIEQEKGYQLGPVFPARAGRPMVRGSSLRTAVEATRSTETMPTAATTL